MKKLLFLFILIISLGVAAQTSTGNVLGWNYVVTLPSNYNTTNINYPTLIFFPGIGEVGTNISALRRNGPHALIDAGTNPLPNWIVISLQPSSAYPIESSINTRLTALKQLFRIDTLRTNLTGLSHGGWMAATFVTGDPLGGPFVYASQVNCVITVQGVIPSDNQPYPQLFSNFKGRGYLCFEQRLDGRDGNRVVNHINSVRTGIALFIETNFSNGGHCCWANFYGGAGTAPSNFAALGNKNIYNWLIDKNRLTALSINLPNIPSNNLAKLFWFDAQFIYYKANIYTDYEVFNVIGQMVLKGTMRPGANKLPINGLPIGMYYFTTQFDKRYKFFKTAF